MLFVGSGLGEFYRCSIKGKTRLTIRKVLDIFLLDEVSSALEDMSSVLEDVRLLTFDMSLALEDVRPLTFDMSSALALSAFKFKLFNRSASFALSAFNRAVSAFWSSMSFRRLTNKLARSSMPPTSTVVFELNRMNGDGS